MKEERQHFNQPIVEVIKGRKSVRNYKPRDLSKEVKDRLQHYITTMEGPFNRKTRFHFIDAEAINEEKDGKIGTYGVIKGANTYIAAAVEKGHRDLEEIGYVFEKLVLYATALDLGTCWLGGTFTKSSFTKIMDIRENEFLPVVTPIGYIERKKRILDSFMRMAAGSDNRKQWQELFFHSSFNQPLKEEAAAEYALPLEMVRLAPSASNKQPWRIVKDNNSWHFYLDATKGYSKKLGFDIQRIDMGIAMCHFEMTAIEQGLRGKWMMKEETPKLEGVKEEEYIISWIEEK